MITLDERVFWLIVVACLIGPLLIKWSSRKLHERNYEYIVVSYDQLDFVAKRLKTLGGFMDNDGVERDEICSIEFALVRRGDPKYLISFPKHVLSNVKYREHRELIKDTLLPKEDK